MSWFKSPWLFIKDPAEAGRLKAYDEDRPSILEAIRKLEETYYRKPFIKVKSIEDKIVQLKKEWNV